jgi:hypothetical protein
MAVVGQDGVPNGPETPETHWCVCRAGRYPGAGKRKIDQCVSYESGGACPPGRLVHPGPRLLARHCSRRGSSPTRDLRVPERMSRARGAGPATRSGPQGWRGHISQAGTCLKPLISLAHLIMVARSSSLTPSIRTFIPLSGSRVVMPPAPERLRVDRLVRPLSGSRSVMPVELRSSRDRLVRPLSGSRSVMPVELRSSHDSRVRPLSGSRLAMPVEVVRQASQAPERLEAGDARSKGEIKRRQADQAPERL